MHFERFSDPEELALIPVAGIIALAVTNGNFGVCALAVIAAFAVILFHK